jgi:hypothetical protein
VFTLRASGSQALDVRVAGPEGFATRVSIAAGGAADVVVPDPGLVTFTSTRGDRVAVAEPYTKVAISL